jgi:hypothetical protein
VQLIERRHGGAHEQQRGHMVALVPSFKVGRHQAMHSGQAGRGSEQNSQWAVSGVSIVGLM